MFTITFASPHPFGGAYVITGASYEVTPSTAGCLPNFGPRTSTSFGVVLRDISGNRQGYSVSFIVH